MKGKDNAAVQYQEEKKIKIVQYQPDDSINLDVRFEDGAVWLTQAQMVTLFERERTVISKHIRNIFAEGELDEESNVHFLHIPSSYKPVKAYSSDVINSVGRRVRSHRTASFLKWAEATAKDAIKPCNEEKKGEIIVYQPDNSLKLDVLLENETVWLTQSQMAYLFQSTKQNIGMHINNAFKEGELEPDSVVKEFFTTALDGKGYLMNYYDLDVIISVGYRVRSLRGTFFRRWATKTLRDHILKGYTLNYHLEQIERRFGENDKRFGAIDGRLAETEKKIDFFVRTSLPPVHGIFYEGQIFDAYEFASDLIRSAKSSVILLDNYADDTVLKMLSKRSPGVSAEIYTKHISPKFLLDVKKHNEQYDHIEIKESKRFHDRFLMIDREVYHIGHSLKDLGKKMFAFSKIEIPHEDIMRGL